MTDHRTIQITTGAANSQGEPVTPLVFFFHNGEIYWPASTWSTIRAQNDLPPLGTCVPPSLLKEVRGLELPDGQLAAPLSLLYIALATCASERECLRQLEHKIRTRIAEETTP